MINLDASVPLTADEIYGLCLAVVNGRLLAFKPMAPEAVDVMSAPPEKVRLLFEAAPFMFRTLTDTIARLEDMVLLCEQVESEIQKALNVKVSITGHFVELLTILQNDALRARTIALEGPEKIAAAIRAGDC